MEYFYVASTLRGAVPIIFLWGAGPGSASTVLVLDTFTMLIWRPPYRPITIHCPPYDISHPYSSILIDMCWLYCCG